MRSATHEAQVHRGPGELRSSALAGDLEAFPEDGGVEGQITRLEALPTAALRIEWRNLYRIEPPTRLSRDLLIRGIAYRIQECTHATVAPAIRRRLDTLAGEIETKDAAPFDAAVVLKPGTRLVREWHGRSHVVIVLEDGFDYDGGRYRSLTQIAKRITGSHWSGPVFFGLKRRPRVAAEPAP